MARPRKTGLTALDYARPFIGTKETGPNRGVMIDKWNKQAGVPLGSPWCMSFARAMFRLAGVTLGGGASVGNFEAWAKENGMLVERPFAGDLVCYRWGTDDWPDHVGIIEKVEGLPKKGRQWYFVRTIEGNTSPGIFGSQANGGGVYRRRRWAARCKFVRVT